MAFPSAVVVRVESAISAGISSARTPVEIPAFVLCGAKGDERSSGITCRGADAQKRRVEAHPLAVAAVGGRAPCPDGFSPDRACR
ncbi:hypothetical protein R4P64_29285 [Rhodococcus sp. IEGM 1366]|uniref:hypothetical protein n=1 Tax=Rhodococcus sp. IEGM 1366 TaxID=3082223 RepID=UPI00295391C7|nr:hypothetical protein [Rhodococcus sp. IEGM 1366]MDV8070634.1 hypothetical protein [Rhodococcus sp. IEGM 1366]